MSKFIKTAGGTARKCRGGDPMAGKKEYRSSRRSRRLIRQAFLELLEERGLDKITVVDIVNRADVTRSTFYVHYPDIYGIIEEIQSEIICRHMEQFPQIEYRCILQDPTPYLKSIAAMLEENMSLFRKLGHNIQVNQHLEVFCKTMVEDTTTRSDIPDEVRNSSTFPIRVHFFLYGVLNTFQRWAEGTLACSLEELCRDVSNLIRQSASGYLDTNWTQQ